MKIILLSGGSGKRLWPLSNDSRSKQFLRVLPSPDGFSESMVQRVWRQLGEVGLEDRSYIVTGQSQLEMIRIQLGDNAQVILEPERRDTFAAIVLAMSYLSSCTDTSLDETVVVMPVDPYVESAFFDALAELDNIVGSEQAPLVLMGAMPTHPSEKYGYIVPEKQTGDFEAPQLVKQFVEKPPEAVAEDLIKAGALWNCGVFAGKLGFFLRLLEQRSFPCEFHELRSHYHCLPKISFDYEVVEKLERIAVLPYKGYWKDLGTWNTLTEEMKAPINGKGFFSHDVGNAHIVNELDIPIAVLGVSNLVVAASPDGILITDKEQSPRIKEVIGAAENRPMYVERFWGWYKVLELGKSEEGHEVLVRHVCLNMGRNLSYHLHHRRDELWTIISGHGQVVLDGQHRRVAAGSVLRVPRGSLHSIYAGSELQWIETQIGEELTEDDIHRVYIDWDQIVNIK